MFEEVRVLTHSSIKISGTKVLYFDPYEIREDVHDADIIFVTHDHFDHYSPEDIKKIVKEDTVIIMPESMKAIADEQETQTGIHQVKLISPGEKTECRGLNIEAVPAYNTMKPFHTKGKKFVGYLAEMEGTTYYVAGDTDVTSENQKVKCDVALVPVGGTYTMNYKDAAKLVNMIKPKLAIPTHYGSVAGSPEDGKKFAELVDEGIEVRVMM